MKKSFGSRIIALLLTLILLFSVASVGVEAAVVDTASVGEETPDELAGLMDVAAGFSWGVSEGFAGAVNGGVAVIGLIFTLVGSSGPTFEEVLFDYLQEMRTEIIGKIDDVQMQVSEMQRELQDFIMLAFELDDFDDVYMDVAQRFDGNSSTDFTSLVTNYASDPNLSDNAKATLLGGLVGDHEQWNQEGTTIYALDTYKNYLLGKTAVFNNKTIYQAAIEYYQSDALLGQEVLDRYDNEFAGRVYATYVAAIPKVLVCLQAKELLLLKQAEELRADAEEVSNPRERQSMIDEAQIKEKEAELCHLKELEYVGSFVSIYEAFSQARATIHPYDFYDRSDTTSPMVTRYMSTELGKRDFYSEALTIYKNKTGKDLNIRDEDLVYKANSLYNTAMMGEIQNPPQTSFLPTLEKDLDSAGLSSDSRKYFADYILRKYPAKTIREFLTDFGFDADSEENSSAAVIAVKSTTADTEGDAFMGSSDLNFYGNKVFPSYSGKLTYNYYTLDALAPEYVKDKIYSAGFYYEYVKEIFVPIKKNTPGGVAPTTLYLQTAPFDTLNLETWISRADDVIATQNRTGKYTSDSYAAVTQKYAAATTVLTNATESPDTVTQGAIDTATSELIHALLSRKVSKDYLASWVYLQERINAAENGDTITLTNDTVATASDSALTFPYNKTLTLDLNGYTLDRDLDTAKSNGCAIIVNSVLTITGEGTITGGNNTGTGGAVLVTGNGELKIEDGVKFEGNAAKSGGAIYNQSSGITEIYDGEFCNNTATENGGAIGNNGACYIYGGSFHDNTATENGGAIWNNHGMLISGGTVTANTAGQNGGVYQNGTTSISGKFSITDNTANGENSNFFIDNSIDQKTAINVYDDLDPDTRIGIRESISGSGTPFTTGLSGKGTFSNFTSDCDDVLIILNSDGEAYTADEDSAYLITFDANGGTGTAPEPMCGLSGQPYTLPDTDLTGPDGKLFEGWMIGETLYSAGDKAMLSSAVTAYAQWGIRDWKSLQKIINLKADGTAIKLDSDYTAEEDDVALRIPESKTLTIDLNGHTIDRGLADGEAVANGNVISNFGKLTITDSSENGDGVITGGNTNDAGGGIYCNYLNNANASLTIEGGSIIGNRAKYGGGIWTSRHLIMTGGSVSGNTATWYGGGIAFNGGSFYGIELYGVEIKNNTAGTQGGGVFNGDWTQVRNCTISGNTAEQGGGIYNCGTLDFYSGVISGNTATQGGGIYSNDSYLSLQLYDTATITGNKALLGGGVYTKGSNVFLSGAPQVTDNTNTTGGADNLYITDKTQMNVQEGFTGDAQIGVSVSSDNTSSLVLTSGLAKSGADSEVFTSDSADYKIFTNSDGEAVLGTPHKILISSSYITADKKTACAGETVTLTVTPREGYTLEYLRCNGNDIVGNTFTMPDYYAIIQANFVRKKYTVTWQDEDGAVLETDEDVTHGSAPSFDGTIPEKEGKTFVGWDNGETVYAAGDLPKVTEDVTYTATYTAIEDDYILGDADGSGEVDIFDVTVIQRKLADFTVVLFNEKAACVTDTELNIFDATATQRYLAGFADPYGIGTLISVTAGR